MKITKDLEELALIGQSEIEVDSEIEDEFAEKISDEQLISFDDDGPYLENDFIDIDMTGWADIPVSVGFYEDFTNGGVSLEANFLNGKIEDKRLIVRYSLKITDWEFIPDECEDYSHE